jgi:integrase/recombinase XerD
MNTGFEQFIRERQYLHNVSPRTIQWYGEAFKWLRIPEPDEATLKDCIVRMREKGLKARSCNSYICAINSYLNWTGSALRVPKLKDEQRVLPTFSKEDIAKFATWKPKRFPAVRLQALLLMLADTGTRIDEVMSLHWAEVDFDNLLLLVRGKGSKERRIPFSLELRKYLWKYRQIIAKNRQVTAKNHQDEDLVFPTRDGGKLSRRNVLRDTKNLCRKLSIRIPERTLHALRHSFAIHYLRAGGSVFHLQKTLGHSDLAMTRKYANLLTEDLQKIHQKVSLLSAAL